MKKQAVQQFIRGKFSIPVDHNEVADNWQRQGFSCGLFIDPPGQQWNDFIHQCDELVTVVDGRLRMIIGNQSWNLEPGDQIFIPQGRKHSVYNIYSGQSRWLYGYSNRVIVKSGV